MEPPAGKKVSLRDVLNYEPETYFSEEEISLIRRTFGGNKKLLNVLRKIFIPTITDPDLPTEQFGDDAFLAGRDYGSIPSDEMKSIVLARQEAIKFICGGIVKLKVISNSEIPSPLAVEERRGKDSTK